MQANYFTLKYKLVNKFAPEMIFVYSPVGGYTAVTKSMCGAFS